MIPVQQVIPGALEAVLRRAPLTREKVAFAWRVVVGPAVDRATSIELRDQVLYVGAKDAAWQREVDRALPLIQKRLTALLGEQTVRRIEFTASPETQR
jgi:Dna[CI] antecedent DciA-like protein